MQRKSLATADQPAAGDVMLTRSPALAACLRRADNGDPDAMRELGLIFATGDGMAPDYVAAHKWFNLAAMSGNREARGMRTELADDMSAAEIAEAQQQARQWQLARAH